MLLLCLFSCMPSLFQQARVGSAAVGTVLGTGNPGGKTATVGAEMGQEPLKIPRQAPGHAEGVQSDFSESFKTVIEK